MTYQYMFVFVPLGILAKKYILNKIVKLIWKVCKGVLWINFTFADEELLFLVQLSKKCSKLSYCDKWMSGTCRCEQS